MLGRSGWRAIVCGLALASLAACGGDAVVGPQPPAGAFRFASVTAGYFHTCGLTGDGRAYCWGGNVWGTLGDGSDGPSDRPVRVSGSVRFTQLDAGAAHSCAVGSDEHIYCWGLNDEGQAGTDWADFGIGVPARLPGPERWAEVSAGHDHSCGRTIEGRLWCWGDNLTGQLGAGAGLSRSYRPVRVETDETFSTVLAGYYQTCALTGAGRMYCWGRNELGQIGDGSRENRFTPVPVEGDLLFSALGGGDGFMCGITTTGETYCWGGNLSGELGDPTLPPQTVPRRVGGLPRLESVYGAGGALTVSTAQAYACGLTSAGEAWYWGGAIRGGLWRGPTDGPVLVERDARFGVLAPGAEHACGVTTDGWAFCGGGNYSGQLGDGTRETRSAMVGVVGP